MGAIIRYLSLAAGLITVILFLWRIAWTLGQLVQRFNDFTEQANQIHADHEQRIRNVERMKGRRN